MRTISVHDISVAVKKLCMEACTILGDDLLKTLERAQAAEESPIGKEILGRIIENAAIARQRIFLCARIPVWQCFSSK